MAPERAEVAAWYERYLAHCNNRQFEQLGEFVAEQVGGSAPVNGLDAYIAGVKAVCTGFPDYRWELQELVVGENTIGARLTGQGTHTGSFDGVEPTGRRIAIQELAVYRIGDGKIVHCWGDLNPVVRDALTVPSRVSS